MLLGLEIFIAADIISSAVSPSWEKVGIPVSIVGVTTVLSYFLRMKLKQGVRHVGPTVKGLKPEFVQYL